MAIVAGQRRDGVRSAIGVAAIVVGVAGLVAPASVRPIYSGWMIVAFPIGWTISKLMLGTVFFIVFTAVGMVFRLTGRDALRMRRAPARYLLDAERAAKL